jgi:hypothetical protein
MILAILPWILTPVNAMRMRSNTGRHVHQDLKTKDGGACANTKITGDTDSNVTISARPEDEEESCRERDEDETDRITAQTAWGIRSNPRAVDGRLRDWTIRFEQWERWG